MPFEARYREGLSRFVEDRSEQRLRTAYELGRAAVQSGLGILDVAAAHTQALVVVVGAGRPDSVDDAIAAAGDFLVESLAAFEMVQRGLTDARRVAFDERRRARMLRELSSVLSDTGIAVAAGDSVGEVAQLVVEIAREAAGAGEAKLVVDGLAGATNLEARATEPAADTWSELFQPAADPDATAQAGTREIVRVPIRALDGRSIGELEVAAADGRRFRQDDRATVAQIAQMTAAWLERVPLRPS